MEEAEINVDEIVKVTAQWEITSASWAQLSNALLVRNIKVGMYVMIPGCRKRVQPGDWDQGCDGPLVVDRRTLTTAVRGHR